jgi:hypothetical protein
MSFLVEQQCKLNVNKIKALFLKKKIQKNSMKNRLKFSGAILLYKETHGCGATRSEKVCLL